MCKVFLFQRSLEAKGGPILSFISGDGGADFGWIGSRNKAKAHGLRDCEVSLNRMVDSAMSSGVETNSKSFDVFPASSLNLEQVLVRKQLIVATTETPGRSPPHLLQIILTKAFRIRSSRRDSHCA
jgi:hypothetical protein